MEGGTGVWLCLHIWSWTNMSLNSSSALSPFHVFIVSHVKCRQDKCGLCLPGSDSTVILEKAWRFVELTIMVLRRGFLCSIAPSPYPAQGSIALSLTVCCHVVILYIRFIFTEKWWAPWGHRPLTSMVPDTAWAQSAEQGLADGLVHVTYGRTGTSIHNEIYKHDWCSRNDVNLARLN